MINITPVNSKGEEIVIYSEFKGKDRNVFLYNINTKEKMNIAKQLYRYTKVENDEFTFIDYDRIFNYNISTYEKKEIILPDDFRKELLAFDVSFEQFMHSIIPNKARRDELTEEDNRQYKLMYERHKANNHIDDMMFDGDLIYLRSYSNIGYVYNIKTGEYKQKDFDFNWYEYEARYERGVVKKDESGKQHGLVEVSEDGTIIDIIDDSEHILSEAVSGNNKRVAYYFTDSMKWEDFTLKVYDFDSKKSITMPNKQQGYIRWNNNGTRFYIVTNERVAPRKYNTEIYSVE